jgi:hypothetical protein
VVQERSFSGIPKRLPYRFSAFVLSFEDRRRRIVCVREQRRCIRYLLSLLGRLGLLSRRSANADWTWHIWGSVEKIADRRAARYFRAALATELKAVEAFLERKI